MSLLLPLLPSLCFSFLFLCLAARRFAPEEAAQGDW
jgi:hypothetical protein